MIFKKILILVLFSVTSYLVSAQRNVILIIADDLGKDYCGFYENHLDTIGMPNIRRLLSCGVRFNKAWSNPLCSPTRAGILTGRYSFRTGVGNAVGGATSAVLDTAEMTIPILLNKFKPNGIAKANIGKWHLQLPTPTSNYIFPNKMGYDHYEGNFTGVVKSYYSWTKVTNGVATNNTNYATTETADNAVRWIKAQNKPFFLWLAFNAPHVPFHLPPKSLHSDTTLTGLDADITANPKPYFKAAMEALDHEIGRVFDSLKRLNKWDSTDIIFIGDNGDDPQVAQNTGGAKGSVYQEGVSVPFIISGPSVIAPGRTNDALVNTHDLFATILELFGYSSWQSQIPGNKPLDSKSILPILKNKTSDIRPWVFTEVFKIPTVAGDGKAMRNKDYKLIDFDNGTQKFFNLTKDPTENNDLLSGTLSSTDQTNYNYLCGEMTTLVGINRFCSTSGVSNLNSRSMFYVIPNPFANYIKVISNQMNQEYRMINCYGQLIYKGYNIENQDFSYLRKGIYFIELVGNDNTFLKLLKE